ncbi:MAG: hypothetical protein ACLFMO_08345 [Eubacteriales bacterium]
MFTDLEREEVTAKLREELNDILSSYPFKLRRKELEWKQVLGDDKKVLNEPKMHRICDLETSHLKAILNYVDYDNISNYDLVLRTIWEEYHYRKNNHLD